MLRETREKLSILSRPLRFQLWTSFALMSVLPVLALLNVVFPSLLVPAVLPAILCVIVALSLLGFLMMKRIVDAIRNMKQQVAAIAEGEVSRKVSADGSDEIGELGAALNQMTLKIKDSMDELKIYGERTHGINRDINRQMVALSGMLEVSQLMGKGADLEKIFEIVVSRLAQIAESSLAFVIFEKGGRFSFMGQSGLDLDAVAAVESPEQRSLLRDLVSRPDGVRIDSEIPSAWPQAAALFRVKNLLVYPVQWRERTLGILGIGNQREGFLYSDADAELMNMFAKQLAVAFENSFLLQRIEDLETKDSASGLYNRRYMVIRLEEEILRAISHQQPCAFVIFAFKSLNELAGSPRQPMGDDLFRQMAAVLRENLGELDRAGRIDAYEIGVIFPGRNKKEAQEVSLLLKEKLSGVLSGQKTGQAWVVSATVVENPVDGADATALIEKAQESIRKQAITFR